MTRRQSFLLGILFATLWIFVIWFFSYEKPTHTSSSTIIIDTVYSTDTIHDTTPAKWRTKIVRCTTSVSETTAGEIYEDTLGCISGEYKAPDSSYISWSACSNDLPLVIRDPIVWDVKHIPAPKITIHEMRVDTIQRPRFWREVKIGGVVFVVGVATGVFIWELAR
jgi:hypothetical protein